MDDHTPQTEIEQSEPRWHTMDFDFVTAGRRLITNSILNTARLGTTQEIAGVETLLFHPTGQTFLIQEIIRQAKEANDSRKNLGQSPVGAVRIKVPNIPGSGIKAQELYAVVDPDLMQEIVNNDYGHRKPAELGSLLLSGDGIDPFLGDPNPEDPVLYGLYDAMHQEMRQVIKETSPSSMNDEQLDVIHDFFTNVQENGGEEIIDYQRMLKINLHVICESIFPNNEVTDELLETVAGGLKLAMNEMGSKPLFFILQENAEEKIERSVGPAILSFRDIVSKIVMKELEAEPETGIADSSLPRRLKQSGYDYLNSLGLEGEEYEELETLINQTVVKTTITTLAASFETVSAVAISIVDVITRNAENIKNMLPEKDQSQDEGDNSLEHEKTISRIAEVLSLIAAIKTSPQVASIRRGNIPEGEGADLPFKDGDLFLMLLQAPAMLAFDINEIPLDDHNLPKLTSEMRNLYRLIWAPTPNRDKDISVRVKSCVAEGFSRINMNLWSTLLLKHLWNDGQLTPLKGTDMTMRANPVSAITEGEIKVHY